MTLRESWFLPAHFRPDEIGHGAPVVHPGQRVLDRQPVSKAEGERINDVPGDYAAAAVRWAKHYGGRRITLHQRYFMTSLALYLATNGGNFAVASEFYASFMPNDPDYKCLRSLQDFVSGADADGLFSAERGGVEEGVEGANRNQNCLFFTSYQKYRLMLATGAATEIVGNAKHITYRGIFLQRSA